MNTEYIDREVKCVWNLMAHGDAREGKWRGNWRMEWVASTLTLPRNMVYPTLLPLMRTPRLLVGDWTDAPRRFKWTHPFRRKTKSCFCACAITFQTQSATVLNELAATIFTTQGLNFKQQVWPKYWPVCPIIHSVTKQVDINDNTSCLLSGEARFYSRPGDSGFRIFPQSIAINSGT